MIVANGCDHAALEAKASIREALVAKGHEVLDKGTFSTDSSDYPDYAAAVALDVQSGSADRGVLICGSGIGMSIAANRFTGVRAALCYTEELAILGRRHNNANILCLGARTQTIPDMLTILNRFLNTEWEGGRHEGRIKKIDSNARGQHAE